MSLRRPFKAPRSKRRSAKDLDQEPQTAIDDRPWMARRTGEQPKTYAQVEATKVDSEGHIQRMAHAPVVRDTL
jgi:hypothetical protein